MLKHPDLKGSVLVLHGYGGCGGNRQYADGWDLYFPTGPVALEGGGAAWWNWDYPTLERRLLEGTPFPDVIDPGYYPPGIDEAAAAVEKLMDGFATPVVLAGTSQGALMATHVALTGDRPVRGLVVMSGGLVARDSWQEGAARLKGLPVLVAHGVHDNVLPLKNAINLYEMLGDAGAQVTLLVHPGGHHQPPQNQVRAWLSTIPTPKSKSVARPR